MPEITDVIPGEDVVDTWGNQIRDRTNMRYNSLANLEASEPGAPDGSLRWTDDVGLVLRTAAAWQPVALADSVLLVGMNGSQVVTTPPGTEATSGDAPQLWPPSFTTDVVVPDGAAFMVATAFLSQVSASGVLNHNVGISFDGTVVNPTRQRGDQIRDITVAMGPRAVTPGDTITLAFSSDRLSGASELSTSAEKRNSFDYRFLPA